ncbi:MAG: hypothetical protein M1832_001998 [Thelocarpon impressellum]|nr:MAG: hypothetical protein M1832_001998 [Thelocarpon impressellum]
MLVKISTTLSCALLLASGIDGRAVLGAREEDVAAVNPVAAPEPPRVGEPRSFALQVDFIQDNSRQPEAFNQSSSTHLFVAGTITRHDRPTITLEVVPSMDGLAVFDLARHDRSLIEYTNGYLVADLAAGRLSVMDMYANVAPETLETRWRFDDEGNLHTSNSTELPLRICREAPVPPSTNYRSPTFLTLRDGPEAAKIDPRPCVCQNVRLHREWVTGASIGHLLRKPGRKPPS